MSKVEETLVLLKPDAVSRGLSGRIIARFEQRGLSITGLKMLQLSREQAEKHYREHQGKPFFAELIGFITSGPLIAIVLCGENAVKAVRAMLGATNPLEALPGSIRGDFALTTGSNVVHGSSDLASAMQEINNFFAEDELFRVCSKGMQPEI